MRTMADTEAEVERLEERLRTAMESGLVAELEALLDDRAVFIDADGLRYDRQGTLELHRSGTRRLTRVELRDLAVEVHAATAVAVVEAELEGVFKGAAFAGRHRYLRVWSKTETGWRIIAASVCAWPRPQDETDG